ncbi:helix-turn-helix transcriptional regulator [Gordonia jinhuaensis]|uniref:Transcriptional regulator ClgR n=1 Tax=Gordonia jinhuaensis TaxID=1517702 RepID=A0A916T0Y7_9ACTN|nr:helix-turn-helix transcriptional regulator [Gordonia jinhuaensis]GGB26181.1 transcriptional regulator ClgR [Gordonia jinhuaensis]
MALLLREALGDRLRRTRTDQGRTLREVSSTARVSLGYLSEVERGQKEASSELLAAICDALEVEIADVLEQAGTVLRGDSAGRSQTSGAVALDPDTKVVIPRPVPAPLRAA